MLEIAMAELAKASVDFYNMTGIKIVLYDENRNVLYSYPAGMCSFCDKVRTVGELSAKCISCDNVGFDVCEKTHKPYIYKCHLGLAEAIAPICENDIIIGYMMLGQILCEQDIQVAEMMSERTAKKYGFDKAEFLRFLSDVKIVSDDFINSAVNMMSMCACYLYCNKIIKNKTDVLSVQIEKYIENHICEELSLEELCRKLYLSRSRLYAISKSSFGMGISDYIRSKRIELAKKMLQTDEKPVNVIAAEAGFSDANYFTRAFKKETGLTPGEYRKRSVEK